MNGAIEIGNDGLDDNDDAWGDDWGNNDKVPDNFDY